MKQKAIDFRELLERLLPLDALPAVDRLHVQRVLQTGITNQVEQVALMVLAKLERQGAVRRLPDVSGMSLVRFQPTHSIDVIAVELPAAEERDGILLHSRASLPPLTSAALFQVRRMLRLDDPALGVDPRLPEARVGLIEQLNQAGREILGPSEVRFIPAPGGDPTQDPAPFDPALAQLALARPERILYCPDTQRAPRLKEAALRRGARSIVLAGVSAAQGESLGLLEVLSGEPTAFRPEDLALVSLLAESCAATLERAARIEKLVFIDALTGVYNRSYYEVQVENEMARARREGASMALCIADIDNFKSFNTNLGYDAGNRVIMQVAQALRSAVRPFDTVARWGGEEFVVLLSSPVQSQDVATVSERLRTAVNREAMSVRGLDGQTHSMVVTVSIGVALFPDHQETAAGLWNAANMALLEAKQGRKNQVEFYRPSGPRPADPARGRPPERRQGA